MNKDYDFGGWATRNNVQCSDGRTIMRDAFKQNDGQKVPLVWNHQHNDPNEVLGHALLENREDGVYAYCKFNDTDSGKVARSLVKNGDVDKLSIYANKLKSRMNNVIHGCIREVSLVLAGANPGAYIDSVVMHGEGAEAEEEVVIYNDEQIEVNNEPDEQGTQEGQNGNSYESISHGDDHDYSEPDEKEDNKNMNDDEKKEETVEDVFNTMNDKQKDAVYAIVGKALEEKVQHSDDSDDEEEKDEAEDNKEEKSDKEDKDKKDKKDKKESDDKDDDSDEENKDGGKKEMKHNVFDEDNNKDEVLQHSDVIASAIKDAKRYGSMKESFLQHAAINNIEGLDKLFPDATELYKEPPVIEKDRDWVAKVMNKVKHTPFSRVKTTFGRLNEEQARAKGYIKGNKKTNIQMSFLNRVTTPTTVYIKNEIDRDDVVDITSFDIVAWQKREMRKQLDKELALAMLLGDGREPGGQDKINEDNIRPVIKDVEMYTIHYKVTEGKDYNVATNSHSENDSVTKGVIRAAIRSRKDYKGSGTPTFFTTEDLLTDMLLIEDQNGRLIYDTIEKLCKTLRVDEIVTIPEMENEKYKDIYGVIVNMADYTAGADKGGSVNMFDDFDIDYNQMKYLIETRMSGALTVPYSAIVLEKKGE